MLKAALALADQPEQPDDDVDDEDD